MAPKATRKSPRRYFSGLSKTKKAQRVKEIAKFGAFHWKDPRAYKGFKTNVGVKTRKSRYTAAWNRLMAAPKAHTAAWKTLKAGATSLAQKAAATGVPLKFIRASYNRGMAAWRTGHRPGATQQQWGYGRVHSFLLCGKTYYTTDADLAKKAKATSASARRWFRRCPKSRAF